VDKAKNPVGGIVIEKMMVPWSCDTFSGQYFFINTENSSYSIKEGTVPVLPLYQRSVPCNDVVLPVLALSHPGRQTGLRGKSKGKLPWNVKRNAEQAVQNNSHS
jgi:hypothetical protein